MRRSLIRCFVLRKDGTTTRRVSPLAWAKQFDERSRHVALDEVGSVVVSTVFIGISTNQGTPLLWETMVFGGKEDRYCRRYASYEEALSMHHQIVKMVKASEGD